MKYALLITARLKSTRLAYKLLKPLKEQRVIDHVIKRAKAARNVDKIVLCTSYDPQDFPLVEAAREHGIYYHTGSKSDVLERLLQAAQSHQADYMVGITADNPLFCFESVERLIERVRVTGEDYVSVKGLPFGCAPYIMKTKAFELINKIKVHEDTEYWPEYIKRPEIFRLGEIMADYQAEQFRLTLDTALDYQLLYTLYQKIPFGECLPLQEVIDYLKLHPKLAEMNQSVEQKWLSQDKIEAIDHLYSQAKDKILQIKQEIYESFSPSQESIRS